MLAFWQKLVLVRSHRFLLDRTHSLEEEPSGEDGIYRARVWVREKVDG